jgi:hypothetical protein
MRIEVEPNGLMARIKLGFPKRTPAIEDSPVQEYLRANKLAPKTVAVAEEDGEPCEVWQYGQCYLGLHMRNLYTLQWQGNVAETLAGALQDPEDLAPLTPGLTPEAASKLAWKLAAVVLENNAAGRDPDDPSRLHFDEDFLRRELAQLVAAGT